MARLHRKGRGWKGRRIRVQITERLLLSTTSWAPPERGVSRALWEKELRRRKRRAGSKVMDGSGGNRSGPLDR